MASFGRQQNLLTNYKQNSPYYLPPAHTLKLVGGPKNPRHRRLWSALHLPGESHGWHAADDWWEGITRSRTPCATSGSMRWAWAVSSNPFVNPQITTNSCPTGQTCIAVDPADGDNGSTTTTTAGSAPTYPMNRVYSPDQRAAQRYRLHYDVEQGDQAGLQVHYCAVDLRLPVLRLKPNPGGTTLPNDVTFQRGRHQQVSASVAHLGNEELGCSGPEQEQRHSWQGGVAPSEQQAVIQGVGCWGTVLRRVPGGKVKRTFRCDAICKIGARVIQRWLARKCAPCIQKVARCGRNNRRPILPR